MTEKASNTSAPLQPLAERMRPTSIDEVVGQTHLTNEGMPFARMLEKGRLSSTILWGPPRKSTVAAKVKSKPTAANKAQLEKAKDSLKKSSDNLKAISEEMANMKVVTDRMTCA